MNMDEHRDAWLKAYRERAERQLTRSAFVETRHICHLVALRLQSLRDDIAKMDSYPDRYVILELLEAIEELKSLIAYIEGKPGYVSGTSLLRDIQPAETRKPDLRSVIESRRRDSD